MTYKLLKDPVDGKVNAILKDEYLTIPMNTDNTDYQAYLKWVEKGNTPLPAEEQA